jgi:branched-chain amino acid transport system substrate-binding protein
MSSRSESARWRTSTAEDGNSVAAYGFGAAATMVQVLKQCGNDPSRANIMKQAANLKDFHAPLTLPGITINTSPDNYSPIRQLQLRSFDGENWNPIGEVISD